MTRRGHRAPHRAAVRGLLLVVVAALLGACQLRTEVNISVAEDGSGTVGVGIGLDEEAVEENPDLLEALEFPDLVEAGWEITGPREEDDGFRWVRVEHGFDDPADVGVLIDQVAGENGPLRDFEVFRADEFAETSYRFRGVVDFSEGVGAITDDDELAAALGEEPAELIQSRVGRAVDELLRFQVAVRLPGDVESNAPTRASNGAVWRPSVLERDEVELTATSTLRQTDRLVWTAVAIAAGVALAVLLLVRIGRWRRRQTPASGS